jgi:hypothetical protein
MKLTLNGTLSMDGYELRQSCYGYRQETIDIDQVHRGRLEFGQINQNRHEFEANVNDFA